jgi:hypothetical protein
VVGFPALPPVPYDRYDDQKSKEQWLLYSLPVIRYFIGWNLMGFAGGVGE